MTTPQAQHIRNQLPAVLVFIADSMEQNPMLHFSTALELARDDFQHEVADMLDRVIRLMQLGMGPFEALQIVAAEANVPAFTDIVTFIVDVHQPDNSFITSTTLRYAAERFTAE